MSRIYNLLEQQRQHAVYEQRVGDAETYQEALEELKELSSALDHAQNEMEDVVALIKLLKIRLGEDKDENEIS